MHWIIKNTNRDGKIVGCIFILVLFGLLSILVDVWINEWFRNFYDVLYKRSSFGLADLVLLFIILAFTQAALQSSSAFIADFGELSIRNTLSIKLYLHNKNFNLQNSKIIKFSDQRISEDLDIFSNKFFQIFINSIIIFIKSFVFFIILIKLSPIIEIYNIKIYGIMAIFSVLYFAIPTYMTYKFGIILTKVEDKKRKFEALLRYNLISSFQGDYADKEGHFLRIIKTITFLSKKSAIFHSFINLITTVFSLYASILPLIILIPFYLNGVLELGDLIRTVAAFSIFQSSISYLFNFYRESIKCFAAYRRIGKFVTELDGA